MAKIVKTSGNPKAAVGSRSRPGKYMTLPIPTGVSERLEPAPNVYTISTRPMEQEQADQREQVFARAVEVIENEERALRWMGTPIKGLGFATPVSLLGTDEGRAAVLKILGQLEYGVW